MSRKRKWLIFGPLALVGLVFVSLWVYANCFYFQSFREPCKLELSADTTYLVEPVQADGTIDYMAVLDGWASQGVTADNNAAILIYQALGDDFIPRSSTTMLKRLQLTPVNGAKHFIGLTDFVARDQTEAGLTSGASTDSKPATGKKKAKDVAGAEWDSMAIATASPWTAGEFPKLAAWLEVNKGPLDLLVKASRLPRYYVPIATPKPVHRMADREGRGAIGMQDGCRALSARAMLRYASGDTDGAWSDAMAVARLGRLISTAPNILDRMVAGRLSRDASEACLTIAGGASAQQAKAYLTDIKSLAPLSGYAECLEHSERFCVLDCIGWLSTMAPKDVQGPWYLRLLKCEKSAYVDWNAILRRRNAEFNRLSQAASLPTFAERNAAYEAIERDSREAANYRLSHKWSYMSRSYTDTVEFLLGTSSAGVYIRSLISSEKSAVTIDLNTVGTMMWLYRAQHGDFPQDLEALRGDYVTSVPTDTFANAPFHYRRTEKGYILYSVGPNMKDDGGKDDKDDKGKKGLKGDKGGEDIVVRLEPTQGASPGASSQQAD